MKKLLLAVVLALVVTGCATKEKYIWKIDGQSYFETYQKYLFKGDYFKAKYYLKFAVKEAKNSSQLKDLATVYLSDCAMQRALFTNVECTQFDALESIVHSDTLTAYKHFIVSKKLNATKLPPRYQIAYKAIQARSTSLLLTQLQELQSIYTKAIVAFVAKQHNNISLEIIDYMIDEASQYGYQALMIEWMKQKVIRLKNLNQSKKAKQIETYLTILQEKI